jgi:glycosyltransferase involved in cell wall biosynthesis
VPSILQQCQIGILTSKSEGLPVALLEYGFQKLGVVLTAVGEIPSVVDHQINGLLVAANDVDAFVDSVFNLIQNNEFRIGLGTALHTTILETYSEEKVLTNFTHWINEK